MRRPGPTRADAQRLALLVALTRLAGCTDEPASAPSDTGETGEAALPGPPILVEPVGRVRVSADAREDLQLRAADLLPSTRVELDGISWSLAEPGPVVRAGQTLRVPLAGALIAGEHELILTHEVDGELLRSDPLTIVVGGASLGPIAADLDPAEVGSGDALIDGGGAGRLAIVDHLAQTVELRTGDWAAPGPTLSLPDLAGELGPTDASVDVRAVVLDGQPVVLTAWLAGGGQQVWVSLAADGTLEPLGPALRAWDLDDPGDRALLGPHELALVSGVVSLDRLLVIAVEARRDAERMTPGDRLLITRYLARDGAASPARALRGPGGRDLDRPRWAQRWLDAATPSPALSLRVAQAYPWLLLLAGNGLPILGEDPGEDASAPGPDLAWLATADGALGARTAFALDIQDTQAQLRVLRIDRWGSPGLVPTPLVDVIALPAIPSGPPSLTRLAGAPIVLIPLGAGQPAWAVRSTGDASVVDELGELGCDAVQLDRPQDGPDPGGVPEGDDATVTLACLAGGVVRIGTLTAD